VGFLVGFIGLFKKKTRVFFWVVFLLQQPCPE